MKQAIAVIILGLLTSAVSHADVFHSVDSNQPTYKHRTTFVGKMNSYTQVGQGNLFVKFNDIKLVDPETGAVNGNKLTIQHSPNNGLPEDIYFKSAKEQLQLAIDTKGQQTLEIQVVCQTADGVTKYNSEVYENLYVNIQVGGDCRIGLINVRIRQESSILPPYGTSGSGN